MESQMTMSWLDAFCIYPQPPLTSPLDGLYKDYYQCDFLLLESTNSDTVLVLVSDSLKKRDTESRESVYYAFAITTIIGSLTSTFSPPLRTRSVYHQTSVGPT